jgi:small subunit ribosomal protein S1
MEIDRHKNRLILSEQAAMRERRKQLKKDLLGDLSEGQIISGRVTSLAEFGAFVDIGGADGLVHLSELTWNRVSHPSEVLELGQSVEVKVISIDRDRNRIGLSLKQLQPEPWSTVDDRYHVGEVIEVEITRLADFGAFARIESDIEGLIHVSELSDAELPPGEVVSPGQTIAVRIIRIDPDRKRIGLSLKRAGDDFDILGLPSDDPDQADMTESAVAPQPDSELDLAAGEAPGAEEPSGDDVRDGTESAETATAAVEDTAAEAGVPEDVAAQADIPAEVANLDAAENLDASFEDSTSEEAPEAVLMAESGGD